MDNVNTIFVISKILYHSSAMQLEFAAQQLLLASAERHMPQKEIKQLCK